MSKYPIKNSEDNQVHQGDIIKNARYYESFQEEADVFSLTVLEFPYSIILTQECDLTQNIRERSLQKADKHDKYLISLLCAPLYNAQHLFDGNHLSDHSLALHSHKKEKRDRELIMQNRDPRYHYIEFDDNVNLVPMIIDFKHLFSLSIFTIEENINLRVGTIESLYRDLISQRFANFLCRIGLPAPDDIIKVPT